MESWQQHRLQPVEEIGRLEIALFNPSTWKPAIYSHSGTDTPCTASLNIGAIADILSDWPIGTTSPPPPLVQYRIIQEHQLHHDELTHSLLPSPAQLSTTSHRDPTQPIFCTLP